MNRKLRIKIVEKFNTQADFAQAVGKDEALISRIVRGRRKLTNENKIEWAKKLDCRPEEIFS